MPKQQCPTCREWCAHGFCGRCERVLDVAAQVGSVDDWAAKAARKIRSEFRGCKEGPTQERTAAIIATFAKTLVTLLRESRREHRHDDDPYGAKWEHGAPNDCCGKCRHSDHAAQTTHYGDGTTRDLPSTYPSGECACGADAWNARIDAAIDGASA